MEPSFDRNVVNCPGCKSNINISVGRYPGGYNDSGGWVLKCATCTEGFPVSVKNPDDLSRVISGASVVASRTASELRGACGAGEVSVGLENLIRLAGALEVSVGELVDRCPSADTRSI